MTDRERMAEALGLELIGDRWVYFKRRPLTADLPERIEAFGIAMATQGAVHNDEGGPCRRCWDVGIEALRNDAN